ncbi:MAG: glycoside hydrolase family 9 protein [Acidobacteriaceae bacterium]|nr:glycoside hydrolase family 9 protein [Acidobacteriaceae bacterium]
MLPSPAFRFSTLIALSLLFTLLVYVDSAQAEGAYIRVNQVGYEAGKAPFRAFLMSLANETGAIFRVTNSQGKTVASGPIGPLLGKWTHSKTVAYNVYALDFSAPGGELYTISVSGPSSAVSPRFAVDTPETLYSGLLLNTLFFYETQRDGADFIANELRSEPGHLKDKNAYVYRTPPLDSNDFIHNVPPAPPLISANSRIDASGGWWDAGDYEKYVETTSYTAALMQIGIRDFPNHMGARAPIDPPRPPVSISYAADSGPGAPITSDFTDEAKFGVDWLMRMWDDKTRTLYYQVDNTQDWDYYGEGDPSSATGNCGGTYNTPFCLITEYDIWTLPQAADHFQEAGDPEACDPDTTFFICNRPVYVAGPAGSKISPNLAGRLAADFALCYQLNRDVNRNLAFRCLKNAEDIFALADLSYADPAPSGSGSGNCPKCLLTISPFDGYPENVWEDDMELGATELYFALRAAEPDETLLAALRCRDANYYLHRAAEFAHGYIKNIYNAGFTDTLNLYDVSGLAHFELYRALALAGDPSGLVITKASIRQQLLKQVNDAISQAAQDAWGFGYGWNFGDSTSHGAGLSVMASEAYSLTGLKSYDKYSQRWLANILGANSWGASFIVGDGSTFPNCIQHQVANLAGALDGTAGGTPILWGAATEGPGGSATSGLLDGMNLCPANGADTFKKFNGNDGPFDSSQTAVYRDNMQSFTTTEPGIDLAATSFLMWSWRMAGQPSF